MDTPATPQRETLRTTERHSAALAIATDGRLVRAEPDGRRVIFVIENALADLETLIALDELHVSAKKVLEGFKTVDRILYDFKNREQRGPRA